MITFNLTDSIAELTAKAANDIESLEMLRDICKKNIFEDIYSALAKLFGEKEIYKHLINKYEIHSGVDDNELYAIFLLCSEIDALACLDEEMFNAVAIVDNNIIRVFIVVYAEIINDIRTQAITSYRKKYDLIS